MSLTAQPGDLCLLLYPGDKALVRLRQRQALLQAHYGGQIYDDVHVTCQRFTPSPQQNLLDLLDTITAELANGCPFPLYTDDLVQFYALFWKNYVIRWQIQRTWAWEHFRRRVEALLLGLNCTLHYSTHQAAVCSALVLDRATNLRPYPDIVFPHHLFDVGRIVLSQIEGPGQFRQLACFQLEEAVYGDTMTLQNLTNSPDVQSHLLKDDGVIPNNSTLPLLVYQGALSLPACDSVAAIESLFAANQWGGAWRNGIFRYHHYHSTAHETLACYSGQAKVQFGGEQGVVLTISRGDVVVIPAGVGHYNLGDTPDFRVAGAYPPGQTWDLLRGLPGERPQADRNIAQVPLPPTDPIYGEGGPLFEYWPAG